MTTFTGTPGPDNFVGNTDPDLFNFTPSDLSAADTVDGGGGSNSDTLQFTAAGTVAVAAFTGVSHVEIVALANGTNAIALNDGVVSTADDGQVLRVNGGTGNDTIDGSAVTTATSSIIFNSGVGNDTLTGGAGSDVFQFAVASLTSGDTVNGGGGLAATDELKLTTAGTITEAALSNVSHIEMLTLANGTNQLSLNDQLVSTSDHNHVLTVNGGTGDDTVTASDVVNAANSVFFVAGGGADTLTGGAGADFFFFNPGELTAADHVNGGTGASVDRLLFLSPGTVAAAALANVSHIESITLANGINTLTLSDAVVASADDSHTMIIQVLGGSNTVDGTGVTSAANRLKFSAGPGNDTLLGGAGADAFYFGGTLDQSDVVDGGTGKDLLSLHGDYSAGLTFSPTTVQNIETLALAGGTSYNLTTDDATVAAGHRLTVLASTLGASDSLIFNGSAETNGGFTITAGAGVNTLTGGAGFDVFNFLPATLTSADSVNGGTGPALDRIKFTLAGTVAAQAFQNVSHIETIVLSAGGANNLALTNAMVGSADDNHLVSVYGTNGSDTVDASGVTTAANTVRIIAGAGTDSLAGGAGADFFYFSAAALDSTDTVNGGTGAVTDTLLFTTHGKVAAAALAGVSHIEKIIMSAGTNGLFLTDAVVGSSDLNHTLTVLGNSGHEGISAAGVTSAANSVRFEGLGGGDRFVFGAGADRAVYIGPSDSTGDANGTAYDTFVGFDIVHGDRIDLPNAHRPTSIATVSTGTLNAGTGTFDSDMATAIGSTLGAHTAVLFHATAGSLHGHDFIVVNPTATAGYSSGHDYVFDVTGFKGVFTTSDFV